VRETTMSSSSTCLQIEEKMVAKGESWRHVKEHSRKKGPVKSTFSFLKQENLPHPSRAAVKASS